MFTTAHVKQLHRIKRNICLYTISLYVVHKKCKRHNDKFLQNALPRSFHIKNVNIAFASFRDCSTVRVFDWYVQILHSEDDSKKKTKLYCHLSHLSHEKNPYYFPLYWLVNRDPYNGLFKSLYRYFSWLISLKWGCQNHSALHFSPPKDSCLSDNAKKLDRTGDFARRIDVLRKPLVRARRPWLPPISQLLLSHRIHGTGIIYLQENHKNQPNVGKYTIHLSYVHTFLARFLTKRPRPPARSH